MNHARIDRWFERIAFAALMVQGALSWVYVLIQGFA